MTRKRAWKIGDLCKAIDIQPYVLRYWETEFPALAAKKGEGAQRTFSEDEVALARRIRQLLYDEGYTIAGAKKRIEAEIAAGGLGIGGTAGGGAPLFEESQASPVEASATPPTMLDTPRDERIETLVREARKALAEARGLLSWLERADRR